MRNKNKIIKSSQLTNNVMISPNLLITRIAENLFKQGYLVLEIICTMRKTCKKNGITRVILYEVEDLQGFERNIRASLITLKARQRPYLETLSVRVNTSNMGQRRCKGSCRCKGEMRGTTKIGSTLILI